MPDTHLIQQKILILGDGNLYDECVTRLLSDRLDWDISHEVYREDCNILDVIVSVTPDVILVNLNGTTDMKNILKLVLSHPRGKGMRILQNRHRADISIIDIYIILALSSGEKYFSPQRCIISSVDQIVKIVSGNAGGQGRQRTTR